MRDAFSGRRGGILALVLLIMALAWFGPLDYRKLVKPDEGRYAEIPREMVASHDWVTPRLNGLKYFEKPALQYWATAAAYEAFGEHDWSARLWPALTGFLGILLAAYTGCRLFGRQAGLYTAAALSGSLLYFGIGHLNTLDMGLSFFMECALCGFLLANRPEAAGGESRRWMLFTWAALGLAVLSKGIVAPVLTGAVLVLYSLAGRDFSPWRRLHLLSGLVLFFAVTAPWFVVVCQRNPDFFHFFFIHEHFERFLTKSHNRFHPWFYFVPVLVAGALPWTTMLPQTLAGAWRRVGAGFQPRRLLLVWAVFIYFFFSISSSKLPSYILPCFPALALLLGDWLTRISRRALFWHLGIVSVLAAAAVVASPLVKMAANAEQPLDMMGAYALWIAGAAGLWLAGCVAAILLARQNRLPAAIYMVATATFIFGNGLLLGHENLAPSNSAASLAAALRPQLTPGVPFYSVLTYEQTLPFYIKRTVTLVAFGDELTFGIEQEPQKAIPTVAEFEIRWRADKEAFALMTPETYAELQKHGLPMAIAARDLRRIVVKKP